MMLSKNHSSLKTKEVFMCMHFHITHLLQQKYIIPEVVQAAPEVLQPAAAATNCTFK